MADHGIQITRTSVSPPPVATLGGGVVGVVGTAPDAAVDGAFGDGTAIIYDQPFRINNRGEATTADLGAGGTLPGILNGIYRQGNVPVWFSIIEVGAAVAAIVAADFSAATFSTFVTQSGFDASTLTGQRWAIIAAGSHRFLAFKNISSADETLATGLTHGREIEVTAAGGTTVLHTYTVEGDFDDYARPYRNRHRTPLRQVLQTAPPTICRQLRWLRRLRMHRQALNCWAESHS